RHTRCYRDWSSDVCSSDLTLDWARRLAPLLVSNGWTVFLTRTSDVDVSLSNRVAFAEAHHADLFVSLHFNSAAPDKRQNGLETRSEERRVGKEGVAR